MNEMNLETGSKPTAWLTLGREARSNKRVLAKLKARLRAAGCENLPLGKLLVAESHPGH